MVAWARAEVGVYGFAARRARAEGWGSGSVFRALEKLDQEGMEVRELRLDPRHDGLKKSPRAAFHPQCLYLLLRRVSLFPKVRQSRK